MAINMQHALNYSVLETRYDKSLRVSLAFKQNEPYVAIDHALAASMEILRQQNHLLKKIVSMIRKYHNHKLQTNPWHRKEEPHNNHETSGRQTKQSNQLPLPHQDDFKTRMDIE